MASVPPAKIAVLGAGLMGHGIAQVFMTAGFDVSIWDPNAAALRAVPERIASHLALLSDDRPVTVTLADTLAGCIAERALIVEAAPEDLAIKRSLIAEIDAIDRTAVIATNTSVLRITEIAEGSAAPGRVIGAHWWNPPYLIPLVEVVRGEATDPATVERMHGWLRAAGKTPIDVKRDVPGFVGNRMQFALLREAAHIVEEGICSAETVDQVARLTFGRRIGAVGPLRNADFVGLDLTSAIMAYLSPSLARDETAPALFLRAVGEGRLGAKTGGGIYDWPAGARDEIEHGLLAHLIAAQRRDEASAGPSAEEASIAREAAS